MIHASPAAGSGLKRQPRAIEEAGDLDQRPGRSAGRWSGSKAQRDLWIYLAKYREATTRENIDAAPADGRIISRASVSNTRLPQKLPVVLIATLATLMLSPARSQPANSCA
jgi:hypothetical protein